MDRASRRKKGEEKKGERELPSLSQHPPSYKEMATMHMPKEKKEKEERFYPFFYLTNVRMHISSGEGKGERRKSTTRLWPSMGKRSIAERKKREGETIVAVHTCRRAVLGGGRRGERIKVRQYLTVARKAPFERTVWSTVSELVPEGKGKGGKREKKGGPRGYSLSALPPKSAMSLLRFMEERKKKKGKGETTVPRSFLVTDSIGGQCFPLSQERGGKGKKSPSIHLIGVKAGTITPGGREGRGVRQGAEMSLLFLKV